MIKGLVCDRDGVLEECPLTQLGAIVNSGNLLVRMLIGAVLSGKVLELASDVLGIICLMEMNFHRKVVFAPSLQLCSLVGVVAR